MRKIVRGVGFCFVIMSMMVMCLGCFSTEAEAGNDSSSEPQGNDTTIHITDIEGRQIVLDQPAKRVVDCTGLGGTRLLVQLEAVDLLVGVTDHTLGAVTGDGASSNVFHPVSRAVPELKEGDLASIGGYNEPNVQAIMALEPDVILVGWGGKGLAESLQNQTGIPAVCIGRMDGHFDYDLLEIVGKVVGKEDRAEALIAYTKEKLEVVTQLSKDIPEKDKKSVYFWIYPRLDKAPRSNGVYDAFDYAGVINVASNDEGLKLYETSKEQIALWNPDYIYLQSFDKEQMDGFYTSDLLAEDDVLKHIDAVKNNRVYKLRGPNADWDTAVQLTEVFYTAKIFYPDVFGELDVEAHGNEIFKTFYGVDNLYSEMVEYLGLTDFK